MPVPGTNEDAAMKSSGSTQLLAGAGRAEITPPLKAGLLMSSIERRWEPFRGVRLPLHARAVAIQQPGISVVLVSLDVLGLAGQALGGWSRFKQRVCAAANELVKADNLILVATHTHSAPESLGLTDISKEAAFRKWVELLIRQVGAAIRHAFKTLRSCRIEVASAEASLSIYRRILTTHGVVLSNLTPEPSTIIPRKMPVDDQVNVATFIDSSETIVAMLVNATCHPVHEMCIPLVSPDYPGEMAVALERRHAGATVLFFNGAAGNINPPTACGGPGNARHHGLALAFVVEEALRNAFRPDATELSLRRCSVLLPARLADGRPAKRPMRAEIAALRIGETAFLFLPGEPFVETGLAIRRQSPFQHLFIIGYAGNTVGYVPTDDAFDEGGYEIGPGRWSYLAHGSEPTLRKTAITLLNGMNR
jgi:neutral ceramidase